MQLKLTVPFLAAIAPLVVSADGVTAISAPTTVDLRAEKELLCVVGTTDIGYSAKWISEAATSETRCVVTATAAAGTEKHVDTVLADTTSEGVSMLSPTADERVYRVTMKAMNGTTEIGSITREIAFGYREWSGTEVRADTTSDKLQHVIDEGGLRAKLECDTSWVPGAASAVLTQIRTPWLNKRDRGMSEQSILADVKAPYDGYYEKVFRLNEGADYEFSLAFKDAQGELIEEPCYAVCVVSGKFGFVLIFR